MAFAGTWRRDRRPKRLSSGFWLLKVKENSIRPVVKMLELQAEAAAVSTTKLMMSAAALMPTLLNTWTNGLVAGLTADQG